MTRMRLHGVLFLLLGVVWTGLLAEAQTVRDAQHGAKRLVLKDGSYQPARSWEVQGELVRFYSTDRFQWEVIPTELVDWEATARFEQQREAGRRRAQRQEDAERRQEEERSPTVAPGLRLPEAGGVYLLDEFQGEPQLIELVQSGGRVRADTRGNILRSAINPLARARQTIELRGTTARIQAHPLRPAIYINLDGAAATEAESHLQPEPDLFRRYQMVKLEKRRGARVVGNLRVALTGRVSEEKSFVETATESVSPHWVRIRPVDELEPGEYALVELLTEQRINLYVWDFGVDPSAPANPATWTPPTPVQVKTGTTESPVLLGKPD